MLNVTGGSTGPGDLWFSVGSYSPLAAEAILRGWSCVSGTKAGNNCLATPSVPLLWAVAPVASSSGPITADAITTGGSGIYAAATSAGTTSLYSTTNGGATWGTFFTGIAGSVVGLVATLATITVLTQSGVSVISTSIETTGTEIGQTTLTPSGSGITGLSGAAFAAEDVGTASEYVVVLGVDGPNEIESASSSDGIHYSSWIDVAPFNVTVPNPSLSSVGQTRLYPPGGVPGQVALTADGSGLFLLFTSRLHGEVGAETAVSSNGGAAWEGPYQVATTPGTVQDPTVVPSASGYVYAAWRSVANGSGTAVEGMFAPNGGVVQPPTSLPGTSLPGVSPTSAPALSVDSFQRPLVLWVANSPTSAGGVLDFSGGFLSATIAAAEVSQIASDPLVPADFSPSAQGSGSPQTTFAEKVGSVVSSVTAEISSATSGSVSSYCAAQNATVESLYSTVTQVPLSYANTETTCAAFTAAQLNPTNSTIAPLMGPDAPNTYLAVYADWLLEAEGVDVAASPIGGIEQAGVPISTGFTATPSNFPPPGPQSASATVSGETGTVTVTPTVYSPTALELSVSATIPTYTVAQWSIVCYTVVDGKLVPDGGEKNVTSTVPARESMSVTLNNGSTYTDSGITFPSSLFLTNLSFDPHSSTADYWTASFSVTYKETATITASANGCGWTSSTRGITPASPSGMGPIGVHGIFWTQLAIQPGSSSSSFISAASPSQQLTGTWANTMAADDELTLVNDTTGFEDQSWSAPANASASSSYVFPVDGTLHDTYTASVTAVSRPGGWLPGETPSTSMGAYGSPSAPQQAQDTCVFTLSPPSETLGQTSGLVSGITSTTADVSWSATLAQANDTAGEGFVTYYAAGTGVNLTDYGVTPDVVTGTTTVDYVAELHGLEPWTYYDVTVGITAVPSGSPACYTVVETGSVAPFHTYYSLPVWEADLAYDSISETGGGALIGWSLPYWFVEQDPTWVAGWLNYSYGNGSGQVTMPLSSSVEVSGNDNSIITLMLAQLNTAYIVNVSLVFTLNGQTYNTTNPPLKFVYERDTSGDGLTDAEKIYGWGVSYSNVTGGVMNEVVTANPALYSTNGLVGDYVEKEFGLNPNTVDTAGSHMLDTWNLTFNLEPGGGSLPSGSNFQIYNEGTSYNPFAKGLHYAPGHTFGSSGPVAQNISNVSASPSHGITSGDGSAWAAGVLWNYTALETFVNLSGVRAASWLRAVEGSWKGVPTLTVWGKLSWGANPLAASALNNGQLDGSRIRPSGTEDLSVNISNLYVTGLHSGQGYATLFRLYAATGPTGTPELTNFSRPVGLAAYGGQARLTNYNVVLPVSQISQYETLQLQVLVNESGSSTLTPVAFNYSSNTKKVYYEANLTYDMVAGLTLTESYSANKSEANPNGSLAFVLQAVPVGGKTQTYLWLPTQNGTTNGLPAGVERYTGEQSFDLVVINASATISSANVPYPWGGNYTLTVYPGLNNLLLPRAQFLNSSFAAAVLEGKAFPYPSSHPTPPILAADSSARGTLTQSFGTSSGLMFDLEAYWQNRSVYPGAKVNFTTAETGISNTSSLQVGVLAVTSTPANNTGGLAANPSVYSSSDPTPPALQAIVTLNITSTATFDLLLTALLDNTTGAWDGVNGTFQNITSQVASLGFDAPVLAALANAPIVSQGLYGTPPYDPKSTSSGGLWGDFWNAVSAVVTTLAAAVVSLVNIVYSVTVAAFTYLNHLAREAATIGGQVLSRVAATMVSVGKTIVKALNALLNYIISLVKAALAAALAPFEAAISAYGSSVSGALSGAVNDVVAGKTVTEAHAAAFWNVLTGALFLTGIAIAVTAEVVIGLLTSLSLGAGFLVGIVVGLVVSAVLQSIGSSTSPNTSGLSKITSINAVAVHACEGVANSTSPPAENDGNWTTNWNALAGVAGWTATLLSTQIGFGLLAAAYFQGNGLILPSVAFGLALVSIALGIAGASGNRLVQETSVGVSGTSVALDFIDFAIYPEDREGPLLVLNGMTAGLDIISLGIGVGELHVGP